MAGIYIHIPFCKQACHYCNFHFSTSLLLKEKMLEAIISELILQKDYTGHETIETIYFGGGTPSLLSTSEVSAILNTIQKNYRCDIQEITLEANPDDLSPQKLKELKTAGINRLSIGVQSFSDIELKWMNRAHNANQSMRSLQDALSENFDVSADLIYGIPHQSDAQWKLNIQTLTEFGIPHISCYALTVEPKTVLQYITEKDKTQIPDETVAARHFDLLVDHLQSCGYEHYEISNFARDKKYALHNTAYWKNRSYLGIGPSAHSFNGDSRQWNVANNALYIQSLLEGIIPFETEKLTLTQKANEKLMTSLRTMWGLNIEEFKNEFGEVYYHDLMNELKPHLLNGNMKFENNILTITPAAKFLSDGIISDLFFTKEIPQINS